MSLKYQPKRFPEKREQFKVMAAAGVPYEAIQKALGVSRACIYDWRVEFAIPARKRGPKAVS